MYWAYKSLYRRLAFGRGRMKFFDAVDLVGAKRGTIHAAMTRLSALVARALGVVGLGRLDDIRRRGLGRVLGKPGHLFGQLAHLGEKIGVMLFQFSDPSLIELFLGRFRPSTLLRRTRPLLPIHLDGDEVLVEDLRHILSFERLALHHVAPVAGRVAHGQEDRLVLLPGLSERLRPPGVPVDRVARMLEQVGAVFVDQPVELLAAAGRPVLAACSKRNIAQPFFPPVICAAGARDSAF